MKNLIIIITTLFAILCGTSCSKEGSGEGGENIAYISGDYGEGKQYKLSATLNGEELKSTGYVSFITHDFKIGDFTLVDIVPDIQKVELKDVSLEEIETEEIYEVKFDGTTTIIGHENIGISGKIKGGTMFLAVSIE